MKLYSLDTETTGLHWQHGVSTFAIGLYSEDEKYQSWFRDINPFTRGPYSPFSSRTLRTLRDHFSSTDRTTVFQNANFDVKAMCEVGVFDWREPSGRNFWDRIIELGHLMHLHDSTDARSHSSLKVLTPRYLDRDYRSEEELDRIVNSCRTFIARRCPDWAIAGPETTPTATGKWGKMDMWLPSAISKHYPNVRELSKYFKADAAALDTVVYDYLRDDCRNTLDLAVGFLSELTRRHTEDEYDRLMSMNRNLFPVIWDMETLGISVDRTRINEGIDACEEMISQITDTCLDLTGDRPLTPATLRTILFEEMGLEPVSWTEKTGIPQVDIASLIKLRESVDNFPLPAKFLSNLLALSKYETKKGYLESYRRVIRNREDVPYQIAETSPVLIFPSLKSPGAGTTRFTSQNPNSQNIEKEGSPFEDDFPDVHELLSRSPSMRAVFGPSEDYWWFPTDYSQLQLRIFAWATQDAALMQAFHDGYDFHDFITRVIFDLDDTVTPTSAQRRIGKNVNFGFIFGASERRIDHTCHRPGLYSYLMDIFPGAKEFIESTKEQVHAEGLVYTLGGYPLQVPLKLTRWGTWERAAHSGVNYIIQGTEGEIVKKAMVDCHWYLKENYPEGRLVMQVHDEIVFQTPARPPKWHLRELVRLMEAAGDHYGVPTPVEMELSKNNFAGKKYFSLPHTFTIV